VRLPRRSELSEQQEEFLMEAPFDKPVLCVGPPGTGKTVLALYRGAVLAQRGDDVDFIMHSKLLNRYVERSVEDLDMDIESRTWHSWVYSTWSHGNGRYKIPEIERWLPDFSKAIQLIKEGKPGKPEEMYWQNLIVDEGQDFPKEFYLFLTVIRSEETIVKGRAAPAVTIFADDNQRMEESRNSTISQIEAYMPEAIKYEVTVNYRNSGPIARLANYFHVGMSTGTPEIPEKAKGAVPQLRQFDTLEDEMLSVAQWLHTNDDLSAGIIVPDRTVQGRVMKIIKPLADARQLKVQKYSSGNDASKIDFYTKATITVVCDKSCKGLEFDGVFIPQIQAYKTDGANEDFFRMKMYVMISRARKHLQLSYAECDEQPQVLNMLPPPEGELLKWKI
jgi:superfamily I DNA and RNA helicase